MSEDEAILEPREPAEGLVVRGADGDPLPQGTRMIEKESYERIIEGLKMAADAASRLARLEREHVEYWQGWRRRLDAIRKIAIQVAGLGDVIKFNETPISYGGDPGAWKPARAMFREGIKQAAGGARQLATCFRGDLVWSRMAASLESILDKLNEVTGATVRRAQAARRLWMPEGFY
jgi:hypothetical protein